MHHSSLHEFISQSFDSIWSIIKLSSRTSIYDRNIDLYDDSDVA
jgi:hypothetical protein